MPHPSRHWFALTALALTGCATIERPATPMSIATAAPVAAVAPPAPVFTFGSPRQQLSPIIDAHQHLMGPMAMALLKREPTPAAVVLPTRLQQLLSARQAKVDSTNYSTLFSEDAQRFSEEQGRWWQGRSKVLDAVSNFGFDHRFVPTSYSADGGSGYISGVLRDDEGAEDYNFVLGLKAGPGGRLRISSEMFQRVMPPIYAPSIDAERLIEVLDDAEMRYSTVLSVAYWFGDPSKTLSEAERIEGTRAENDWVIAQTQKYPDRLIPFCGVNPVADYAIAELERCAAIPAVKGMKIHRNSKFDVAKPEELAKVQAFFRAANQHRLGIVVHLIGDPQIWIDQIFPYAPDVPIQIAHMGSGWANTKLFADAIAAGRPGTKNLWFDWTQALPMDNLWGYGPSINLSGKLSDEAKAQVVEIMRKIGTGRILYGSDMALSWNPSPRDWWRRTILTLPLTDEEIRDIADNMPPYTNCRIDCDG